MKIIKLVLGCLLVSWPLLGLAAPAWALDATNLSGTTIPSWTGTTGNDNFNNQGTVSGDVDMTQGGQDTFVNNSSVNGSVFLAGGGGSITNSLGGTIAIDITGNYYGTGDSHITNNGLVSSIYGTAFGVGNFYITNNGTVYGNIFGNYHGTGDAYITNNSSVNGALCGNYGGTGDSTIINSGSVGDIKGNYHGGTGDSTIINSGSVTAHIMGNDQGTGNPTIINSGSVGGNMCGSYHGTGVSYLTNSGRVVGEIDGTYFGMGDSHITNSGRVDNGIIGNYFGTGNSYITNSGRVSGDITGNQGGTGNSYITNSGTVGGSILAGPGNDTVTILPGSNVGGLVDGQAGTNTLVYQLSGSIGQTGLGTTYLNFRNYYFGATDGGVTTLTGVWNFSGDFGVVSGGSVDITGTVTTTGVTLIYGNLGVHGHTLNTTSLYIYDTGTVNVYGDSNVSGATTVEGTLNVNSGGVFNTGSLGIGATGTANVYGTATVSGHTQVDGSLSVASGGMLNADSVGISQGGSADVSGTLSAGSTDCAGLLHVDGTLNSGTVVIRPSGLLWGSGSVNGSLSIYGTVAPGNSIGTLHTKGSLSFQPGSLYLAELNSNGQGDLIAVTGPATVYGGTVQTSLPQALYADRFSWTLLSATGGVTGYFDGVDGQPNSQTLSLHAVTYADHVSLEVWRRPFASFGGGSGAAEVGAGLDAVVPLAVGRQGDLANLLYDMDWGYSAAQISGSLRRLSPEMYASYGPAGLQAAGVFDRALERRADEVLLARRWGLAPSPSGEGLMLAARDEAAPLAQPEAPGAQAQGWSFWGSGLGSWSNRAGDDGRLGPRQDLGGVAAGVDGWLNPWLLVGLGAAATRSNLDWGQTYLDGDLQGVHTGVYAAAQAASGLHGQASLSYSQYTANGRRDIDLPQADHLQAQGSFQAWSGLARLDGGYDLQWGGWLAGPTAGLRYARWQQDAFDESGAGGLGLKLDDADYDSLGSSLGLRASHKLAWGGWQVLPRLSLEWRHEYVSSQPEITARFPGYGQASFSTAGQAPVADLAVAQAGFTVRLQDRFSAFLDYSLAQGQGYGANTIGAGLQYQF